MVKRRQRTDTTSGSWPIRLLLALTLLGSRAAAMQGQEADDALPVGGTLTWNVLVYGGEHGSGFRFAGRAMARIGDDWHVGFGVGSWAVFSGALVAAGPSLVTTQSEAVVYQAFGQLNVWKQLVFTRAGVGIGQTRTLVPAGTVGLGTVGLAELLHWRPALSAGVGIDIPLTRHTYFSPTVDYTYLRGVPAGSVELHQAWAFGLGLTVR